MYLQQVNTEQLAEFHYIYFKNAMHWSTGTLILIQQKLHSIMKKQPN